MMITGNEMRNNPLLKAVITAITEQTSGTKCYISEAELAQTMAISRTRLRETLQTLSAYGIIEKRQKLGIAIKSVTRESVQETYELRELLEGHAIKVALDYITADDIQELDNFAKTIKLADQINDRLMAAQYDLKFHHKIIDISKLPLLKRILDNLHLIENSFVHVTGEKSHRQPNPYSHRDIVIALKNRDKKSIKLLQNHIAWIREREVKKFDSDSGGQTINFQPLTTGGELLTAVNY
jgi:DNA-binding GntR family transcriptional regulator